MKLDAHTRKAVQYCLKHWQDKRDQASRELARLGPDPSFQVHERWWLKQLHEAEEKLAECTLALLTGELDVE